MEHGRQGVEEDNLEGGIELVITQSRKLVQLLRRALTKPPSEALRSEIQSLVLVLFNRPALRMAVIIRPGPSQWHQRDSSSPSRRLARPPGGNTRNTAGHAGGQSTAEAAQQSGAGIECVASRPKHSKRLRLRCFFYFDPDTSRARCQTTWENPSRLG